MFERKRTEEPAFVDGHCHVMNLNHPSFMAFLDNLQHAATDRFFTDLSSLPEILQGGSIMSGSKRMMNLLCLMEHSIGNQFQLLEDDLKGKFRQDGAPPFLDSRGMRLGNRRYKRIILAPMLMDFGDKHLDSELYYNAPPKRSIERYLDDVLRGIHEYHKARPDGILEIYPFLGINTTNYTLGGLEKKLKSLFSMRFGSRQIYSKMFNMLNRLDVWAPGVGEELVVGVKLYPPLGFDPWPVDNHEEFEKVNFLYSYCQELNIPLTTHCNDQGYNTISVAEAWKWSAPKSWIPVLEKYPKLKLNFAHFGKQYFRKLGMMPVTEWQDDIIKLILKYPQVYTDLSFSGAKSDFYKKLRKTLDSQTSEDKEKLCKRIIFGSDFMINLSICDSYYDYLQIFDEAKFSPEEKHLFCSVNPTRFMFS